MESASVAGGMETAILRKTHTQMAQFGANGSDPEGVPTRIMKVAFAAGR
jgi:hypothetical protein